MEYQVDSLIAELMEDVQMGMQDEEVQGDSRMVRAVRTKEPEKQKPSFKPSQLTDQALYR